MYNADQMAFHNLFKRSKVCTKMTFLKIRYDIYVDYQVFLKTRFNIVCKEMRMQVYKMYLFSTIVCHMFFRLDL